MKNLTLLMTLLIFANCSNTDSLDTGNCKNSITSTQFIFCNAHSNNMVSAKDYYINKSINFKGKIWQIHESDGKIMIDLEPIDHKNIFETCYFTFTLAKSQRELIKKYNVKDSINICGNYFELKEAPTIYLFNFNNSIIQ